jgi:hypothetical protein
LLKHFALTAMSKMVVPGVSRTSEKEPLPPKICRTSSAFKLASASTFSEYRASVAFSARSSPSSVEIHEIEIILSK